MIHGNPYHLQRRTMIFFLLLIAHVYLFRTFLVTYGYSQGGYDRQYKILSVVTSSSIVVSYSKNRYLRNEFHFRRFMAV